MRYGAVLAVLSACSVGSGSGQCCDEVTNGETEERWRVAKNPVWGRSEGGRKGRHEGLDEGLDEGVKRRCHSGASLAPSYQNGTLSAK